MEETPPSVRGDQLDSRPDTLLILLLAFLIPGAGHALLGRLRKGVSFFVIVGFMFTAGLLLDGKLYDFDLTKPLTIGATLASHGSGAFDLAARFTGWSGNPQSGTYEYGTTFILTAGVMNLLLILDVWESLAPDEENDGDESSVAAEETEER